MYRTVNLDDNRLSESEDLAVVSLDLEPDIALDAAIFNSLGATYEGHDFGSAIDREDLKLQRRCSYDRG